MTNDEVARILDEIGDLLDIQGESPFRVGAYHKAANSIRSLAESIEAVFERGELRKIPGVGEGTADRVGQLLSTGRLPYYEALRERVPPSLVQLMQIPGLGAKTAKKLYDELGVTGIDELVRAIEEHRVRELKGMGPKTEENILRGIKLLEQFEQRIVLSQAYPAAEEILDELRRQPFVERADSAGSLRRMKETIGDIDLLASSNDPRNAMEFFCALPQVAYVLAKGDTKSSIVARSGLQMDLRVVAPEQYGAALQYFTGSRQHNIHIRDIAKKRGLKINEYGIFDVETDRRIAGQTEEEIYGLLDMPYIPAVLREDRGEIEAALKGRLPELIGLEDIKGDLQVHTTWSDGVTKLPEMVEAARALGYSYICISDHAERLFVAGGLTVEELREQMKEISELNEGLDGFQVLTGIELNIDNDGNVDYEPEVLRELDVVIASIHGGFNQPKEQLTRRMITAMENEHVDIIAHPTGRVLGKRPPYDIDLPAVFRAAAKTGTILELNAYPDRLDLKDDYLREGKEWYGLKFAINTDSHNESHLRYMAYGVAMAQRGWLGQADVINTRDVAALRKTLKR